jgi:hypothetical protein
MRFNIPLNEVLRPDGVAALPVTTLPEEWEVHAWDDDHWHWEQSFLDQRDALAHARTLLDEGCHVIVRHIPEVMA